MIWHIFWGNYPGKNFLRLSQLNTTKECTNTYYNSPWFTSTYFDLLKIIHNLLPNAISHLVLLSHFQISNVILKLSQVRYKSLRVIKTWIYKAINKVITVIHNSSQQISWIHQILVQHICHSQSNYEVIQGWPITIQSRLRVITKLLPKSSQKILSSKSQCCRSMLVITANNCITILQISTWEQQIYVLSTSGKQQQQIKLKYITCSWHQKTKPWILQFTNSQI